MKRPGYDIIGDIHGNVKPLRSLLKQMGYKERAVGWKHPRRHAIFVGDILNRGPEIRESLRLVRAMVEAGSATLLLGNHELYALYNHAFPDETDPFAAKARRHLSETIWQYRKNETEWHDALEWLSHRPLWFAEPGLRVVHACWDLGAMRSLKGRRLKPDDFHSLTGRRFLALRRILEGPNLTAPSEITPEGKPRSFRVKWWMDSQSTWANCGYPEQPALPSTLLPWLVRRRFSLHAAKFPPTLFGHYGFLKKIDLIQPNLACVDMGAAKGGPLVAYRWKGERILDRTHFEWV